MPTLLERVPTWPADQVWCDGVSFFDKHLLPPNGMRALGYCIWRAYQSDGFDDQPTAGIQLTELVEVAMLRRSLDLPISVLQSGPVYRGGVASQRCSPVSAQPEPHC